MVFKLRKTALLKMTLMSLLQTVRSQDSLCIKFDDPDCSNNPNTWAVGTPNLTVAHTFSPGTASYFTIGYTLQLADSTTITLCSYQYSLSAGSCSIFGSQRNCINCANNVESDGSGSVVTQFYIDNMDVGKNQSTMRYATGSPVNLIQFVLEECPENVENAIVLPSSSQCGYGCTSQITCSDGYYNSISDSPTGYQCSATAEWTPAQPVCLQEITTTATMLVTTTDKETSESTTSQAKSTISTSPSKTTQGTGCEECDCCTKQETAAITITVIGSIFVAVEIGIAIYSCNNKPGVEHANLLFAAFGVCAVAWITSVIVLFVVKGNCPCTVDGAGNCTCMAAGAGDCTCPGYIAGSTIGGISIVGMVVSIGIHIWAITANKSEAKSTPGIRMEK